MANRPSRGRVVTEPSSRQRGEYQRDSDRITHSAAFRRLAHKTQVFISPEDDHVRSRLTHTIEVAQIARSLARSLGLDEDLAEAVALAHDLGHPPFGHVGEDALNESLSRYGGFDHNAQSVAIVERLERRYEAFDGLNLTTETVEGIICHNGPLLDISGMGNVPREITRTAARRGIDLSRHASAEAQCAAIADDIAYDCHDIEDAVRSNMMTIADLSDEPLISAIVRDFDIDRIRERERAVHEIIRRLMSILIDDVLAVSQKDISRLSSPDDVWRLGRSVVRFSDAMARDERHLKDFLSRSVYRDRRLSDSRAEGKNIVSELCEIFTGSPDAMPERWRPASNASDQDCADKIRDYVSGMTDRFAIHEHRRLHSHHHSREYAP